MHFATKMSLRTSLVWFLAVSVLLKRCKFPLAPNCLTKDLLENKQPTNLIGLVSGLVPVASCDLVPVASCDLIPVALFVYGCVGGGYYSLLLPVEGALSVLVNLVIFIV